MSQGGSKNNLPYAAGDKKTFSRYCEVREKRLFRFQLLVRLASGAYIDDLFPTALNRVDQKH